MKLKVYHGTSTIFIESIKENGLRAFDTIQEYNVLKALSYLMEIIPEKYKKDYSLFVSNVRTDYKTI